MTDIERAKQVVNDEAVRQGVDAGFRGTVDGGFVEEQIAQTVEVSGAAAEAEDLNGTIDKLKKSISHTKILAIVVWALCFITFIGRFCM